MQRIVITHVISTAGIIVAAAISVAVTVATIIISTEIRTIRGIAIIAGAACASIILLESHRSIVLTVITAKIVESIFTWRRTIETIIGIIVVSPAKWAELIIRLLISKATAIIGKCSVSISVASAVVEFAKKSIELISCIHFNTI